MPIDVKKLQKDLVKLGFDFVKRANPGELDVFTWQGIREFRRYSPMQYLAKEDAASTKKNYVDRLTSVDNPQITTGTIHDGGDDLLALVKTWTDSDLPCPLVI